VKAGRVADAVEIVAPPKIIHAAASCLVDEEDAIDMADLRRVSFRIY
jgi:hypothetical protein